MICSLKFKKDVYLKNVALDFVLLVFKLYSIQVVSSAPLLIKLTTSQLLLFFLFGFRSFFGLRWMCCRNQPFFTVWLVEVYFSYSANYNAQGVFAILFVVCSDLLHCPMALWSKQQKVLKTVSKSFWAIPHKSHHVSLFWCMLRTATPDILSSRKNINSTTRASWLSFRFLWLCSHTQFLCF